MKKQLYLLLTAVLMMGVGTAWATTAYVGTYDGTNEVTASTVFTGNTTVTAHWPPYVASVNDGSDITYYTDFVTALAAWKDNSTLTLLADVTHNAIIDLTSGTRTIDLNGHGIRHTGTQGIFCVVNGATLTLEDSDPTTTHKFSVDENGFATLDEENGTVTIHGGYLTGGIGSNTYTRTASYHDGGALFIYNGSTVTMNGGTLIGNGEAANDRTGGAVFIARNGHFIMNGGMITRNRAKYGGGISLYGGRLTADIAEQAPSTLEIHGGEISYNYATGNSGGVHINAYTCAETVYITGGSIINNHVPIGANAGGMFVEHTNTTVYLSGNPVIKDNLSGTVQRNIQLHSTYVLHINGELTNTEPIGITKSVGAGIFTSSLSGNGDATHFSSDIALYTIALHSNGEAKLCSPASCTAPTAIDGLIYTGVAQALVNAGSATGGTMMYSLDNDTWDAAVPTAKNAGNYTVYYKVIGDETHADYTPSPNTVAVSIAKAPLTITADEKWIDYGDELMYMVATYTGFVNGEGPGYVQPAVQFSSNYTQGDNAGTYTITPYGAGAANYEISYIEGTLHVNKVYAVITITPTAIDGLVANGSAQTLINAGEATGGEMKYSLDNFNWSTDLPTGTDAGDYTVYYRVAGDINHYSTGVASLSVTIAAPSPAPTYIVITANEDPENAGVYYATFYDSSNKYALPDNGTKAFVAELSGTDLLLHEIASGAEVLPANTAVILQSPGNSISLTLTDAAAVSVTDPNCLEGTDEATAAPANCYVISGHSSDNSVVGVGFYQFTGTLKANKAYTIYSGGFGAPKRMRFIFNQEQTATGLGEISQEPRAKNQKLIENGQLVIIKNGVRYNAQGQIVK
jgi:methionine-rich copper-binding protein CopC